MYEGIEDIYKLLESKRLKEAFVQLEAICTQAPDWKLHNRIEELQTTYGYMLQYARQGMKDPNRKEMYHQILRTAYELTDWANVVLQASKSGNFYYQHLRTYNQHPALPYTELRTKLETYMEDISTVSLLLTNKQRLQTETEKISQFHETYLNELFNKTWTSIYWNEAEAWDVQQIIDSLMIGSNDKAVLVSAVMMSLMHVFDSRKMHFLITNSKHQDVQVRQRAIVGLVIIAEKYLKRIPFYPTLVSQFTLLNDDKEFCRDLFNIQIQLLMTKETDKVIKRMNEDIIPSIMKAVQLNKKEMPSTENIDEEDLNPEWEKWMEKSGVNKKIQELGNLQLEGADIYMSAFASIKSHPFFNQVSHWFYPFDKYQSDILSITLPLTNNRTNTFNIILETDTFCNSDKYSFAFTLMSMPKESKDLISKQIEEQIEMEDEQKRILKETLQYSLLGKNISRQYIQDLYRYSKIWVTKHPNQESDFFTGKFQLWKNPYLNISLLRSDALKGIADFLFYKKHYNDALEPYTSLAKMMGDNTEIHQKIGYIYQKMKQYDNAIHKYQRADLLSPDNVWTLKHLAQCCKLKYDYQQALEYYRKIERLRPEDLNIAQQIGECLVGLMRYEEALAYFYKVEYLEKNPIQTRRAIAWSSFCIGKFEEASKYYQLLLQDEKPLAQDWLNAGHTYWLKGDIEKAVEHYKKSQELCKSHSDFISLFNEDKPQLITIGITEEDIHILLDLLI